MVLEENLYCATVEVNYSFATYFTFFNGYFQLFFYFTVLIFILCVKNVVNMHASLLILVITAEEAKANTEGLCVPHLSRSTLPPTWSWSPGPEPTTCRTRTRTRLKVSKAIPLLLHCNYSTSSSVASADSYDSLGLSQKWVTWWVWWVSSWEAKPP